MYKQKSTNGKQYYYLLVSNLFFQFFCSHLVTKREQNHYLYLVTPKIFLSVHVRVVTGSSQLGIFSIVNFTCPLETEGFSVLLDSGLIYFGISKLESFMHYRKIMS